MNSGYGLNFRQGQLTIESSDSDLDKVIVTYS